MNFDNLTNTCMAMWLQSRKLERPPVTICVLGPPGVGKTAAGKHLADMMTAYVRERHPSAPPAVLAPGGALDLSSMLPEDLMGLPDTKDIDPETGKRVTKYIPQSWLAPFCQEGAYGVLILDDLPAAQGQVQVACRQVSLERRIHDMPLAPGVMVIVTGNRREDKSAAKVLPAHFRNSVCMLGFSPEFEGWEQWYMEQGYDSVIPAFLHYRPAHFSRLPKDADTRGAFATPRTWSLLGSLYPALTDENVVEVACGLVGDGVASEFEAFRMVRRELVDPARVLEDPKGALPDLGVLKATDRMIAMATGLGEVAAQKAKGKRTKLTLVKYLRALAYITSTQREYVSASLSTFTACGGEMKFLLKAARDSTEDADIRALIRHLAKALER